MCAQSDSIVSLDSMPMHAPINAHFEKNFFCIFSAMLPQRIHTVIVIRDDHDSYSLTGNFYVLIETLIFLQYDGKNVNMLQKYKLIFFLETIEISTNYLRTKIS